MYNIQRIKWPAPPQVKACYTLRSGGTSQPPYRSFNLGDHVGDHDFDVAANRRQLAISLQQEDITWLNQVHGTQVSLLDSTPVRDSIAAASDVGEKAVEKIGDEVSEEADAITTRQLNRLCCVMTADCLPVFFCNIDGTQVAVAHAGWRGLLGGILQETLATFERPSSVMAYLGPAISDQAFEVGDDLRMAFLCHNASFTHYFEPSQKPNKWMANLYGIATAILHQSGVSGVYGGDRCTFTEKDAFFSYRRDGVTGRMANLIWLE
jgi:YfiH family protein